MDEPQGKLTERQKRCPRLGSRSLGWGLARGVPLE